MKKTIMIALLAGCGGGAAVDDSTSQALTAQATTFALTVKTISAPDANNVIEIDGIDATLGTIGATFSSTNFKANQCYQMAKKAAANPKGKTPVSLLLDGIATLDARKAANGGPLYDVQNGSELDCTLGLDGTVTEPIAGTTFVTKNANVTSMVVRGATEVFVSHTSSSAYVQNIELVDLQSNEILFDVDATVENTVAYGTNDNLTTCLQAVYANIAGDSPSVVSFDFDTNPADAHAVRITTLAPFPGQPPALTHITGDISGASLVSCTITN